MPTFRPMAEGLPGPAHEDRAITVLIASPDRAECETWRDYLETGGYVVLSAHTAALALDAARMYRPGLVLLDEKLCVGQAPAQLKQEAAPAFLPVIVTAEANSVVQWTSEPLDRPDAVVRKPIQGDDLVAWVDSLLRIRQQVDDLTSQNQALQAASREVELLKRDIMRNVSHELSTPLVQIKAAVSLLIEDLAQYNGSVQVRVGDMAAEAVARLESAVENIRQLAQSHDIRPGPVIVAEAVNLALRHLERSWASRWGRNRVKVEISPDLPLVRADKRALARLLQLLLDNALKFSAEAEHVMLQVALTDEDQVQIDVRDFGIGIAEENHDRIFEAFFQVDGSPTRRYGGTGTGLALALLLAQGMNTEIMVDSAPGQGSTFSFRLPVIELGTLNRGAG